MNLKENVTNVQTKKKRNKRKKKKKIEKVKIECYNCKLNGWYTKQNRSEHYEYHHFLARRRERIKRHETEEEKIKRKKWEKDFEEEKQAALQYIKLNPFNCKYPYCKKRYNNKIDLVHHRNQHKTRGDLRYYKIKIKRKRRCQRGYRYSKKRPTSPFDL